MDQLRFLIVLCLVLGWTAHRSFVRGDPLPAASPIWYSPKVIPSFVYQKSVPVGATGRSAGESRAFLSPIYYAPAVTRAPKDLPGTSIKTTTISTPTPPLPKPDQQSTSSPVSGPTPKKYDIFNFFEKLKRINEKYATPTRRQKQLNGDNGDGLEETVPVDDNDAAEDPQSVGADRREDRAEMDNDNEGLEADSSEMIDSNAEAINEGRKKFHSHGLIKFKTKGKKKLSKILYPIIVGLVTAKSILIPLFFKAVVVLSKFSFFVSTLSFIISSILGVKVLLLSSNNNRRSNDNTRVEVVHVPLQQKYPTTYSSSSSSGWIDRDSESNNKFIPMGLTGFTAGTGEAERIIYEKPYSEQEKGGLEKDSYLPL